MKKSLKGMVILSTLLFITILGACGNQLSSNSESKNDNTDSSNVKPIPVIMTHELSTNHWKHSYMQKFADLIKEKSNGRLAPELFPSGQLYSDSDAVSSLGTDSVHITWPISSVIEQLNGAYGLLGLPFAIQDDVILSNPEYLKELNELLSSLIEDKNIKNLGLLRSTEGIFVTKDKRMQTIEDLKGLKVRAPNSQIYNNVMDSLGATGVGLPASEMTVALSQGTIDAIITSPDGWTTIIGNTAKFGVKIPGMFVTTYTMVADDKWFNSLPKDLQEVILEVANEISQEQWQFSIDEDREGLEEAKTFGTIDTFTENEIKITREKVQSAIEKFKQEFPEEYDAFNEIQKKYNVN